MHSASVGALVAVRLGARQSREALRFEQFPVDALGVASQFPGSANWIVFIESRNHITNIPLLF